MKYMKYMALYKQIPVLSNSFEHNRFYAKL